MHDVEIITETEGANQWTYAVRVFHDGRTRDHTVTLNWSDYDLWSHGRSAPEKVVQAVFAYFSRHGPDMDIPAKFDCSLIRRQFPNADAELPKLI